MSLALLVVISLAGADYAVDQAPAQGLWLHSAAFGGVVGGDVAAGVDVGVGVDTNPFAVHLGVPLTLRLVDLEPQVGAGQPAACRWIRCEEWLEAGAVSPGALTKIVEDVRVFRPGDVLYVKGGGLLVTLGHGLLVDEYTNASDWDRRRSGLYVQSDLPWGKTEVNAFTGSFLEPLRLFGARLSTAPLSPPADDDSDDGMKRLLGRLRLGFEAAADAQAPGDNAGAAAFFRGPPKNLVDRDGDIVPSSSSRPVGGAVVDVTWQLFDDGSFLNVAPWAGASVTTGLRNRLLNGDGGPATGEIVPAGVGGAAGLAGSIDVAFVALRAGASATLSSAGHRFGSFDTLYDVDRRRYALFGRDSFSGGPALRGHERFSQSGIADLPSPGGVGVGLDVETVVLRVVRAGARAHLDPIPEATRAELFAEVDAGPVRVDARWQQRAFGAIVNGSSLFNDFTFGDRSFVVVDAAWQIYPPFSLFARWLHGPRFRDGVPQADDDVVVGASFDLTLSPS